MYYSLVLLSAALFSIQFLFHQSFGRRNPARKDSALIFGMETGAFSALLMCSLAGFRLHFSWFSLFLSLFGAALSVALTVCGIRALGRVNLSVYSVFMMLGGMLLPFLSGIFFFDEALTAGKIAGCVLIVLAVSLSVAGDFGGWRAAGLYLACFVLNGLFGVLSKVHQSDVRAAGSTDYMFFLNVAVFVLSAFLYLVRQKTLPHIHCSDLKFAAGSATCGAVANLLLLIALTHLPASVQYPLVTGGTMVFSFLISLVQKEKISGRSMIAVLVAVISSVLVIL